MGDVVDLHGQPAHLEDDLDFVADCCRYAENILSEAAVKKKYHFDDATWERLGSNEALIEVIEAEKVRRIRNGSTKRERAQQLVVQAPNVLGDIMLDASASPKHRIDCSQSIRCICRQWTGRRAGVGPIRDQINLGSDVLRFDKIDRARPQRHRPLQRHRHHAAGVACGNRSKQTKGRRRW